MGFIGCPCALGSPFISTTHTHTFVPSRPLVMSSFSCLLCARACTLALTLASRLPSGRRVCVTLGIIGILLDLFGLPFCFLAFVKAGGPWTLGWHGPTKTHPSCRENAPAWCTWAHYKTQLVATLFPLLSANAAAVTHGAPSPGRPLDRYFLLELMAT